MESAKPVAARRRLRIERVLLLATLSIVSTLPLALQTWRSWNDIARGRAVLASERVAMGDIRSLLPLVFHLSHLRVAAYRKPLSSVAYERLVRIVRGDLALAIARGMPHRLSGDSCLPFSVWRGRLEAWLRDPYGAASPDSGMLVSDAGCFSFQITDNSVLETDQDRAIQDLAAYASESIPGLNGHLARTMLAFENAQSRGTLGGEIATARSIGYVTRNRENIDADVDLLHHSDGVNDATIATTAAVASAAERRFETKLIDALTRGQHAPAVLASIERLALATVDANEPLAYAGLAEIDRHLDRAGAVLDARRRASINLLLFEIALTVLGMLIASRAIARWHSRKLTYVKLERDALASELARAAVERSLSLTEGQLRAVFDSADFGIVMFDDRRMPLQKNDAYESMRLVYPDLDRLALDGSVPIFAGELENARYDCSVALLGGETRHLSVSLAGVYDDEGRCHSAIATIADVTDSKIFEERLRREALRDGLTGLANRRAFEEALRIACLDGARPFALFYIDLDRFKPINDAYGHAMGDTVLTIVGSRLRAAVTSDDVAARLGGDEFAVIAHGVGEVEVAKSIALRLLAAIAERIVAGETSLEIAASIGVALEGASERSPDATLARADAAMYDAKHGGGGFTIAAGNAEAVHA